MVIAQSLTWLRDIWLIVRDQVQETTARHPFAVILAAFLGPTLVGVIILGSR